MGHGSGRTARLWALLMGSQRSGATGIRVQETPLCGVAPWFCEAQDKQGLPLCGCVLLDEFCGRLQMVWVLGAHVGHCLPALG